MSGPSREALGRETPPEGQWLSAAEALALAESHRQAGRLAAAEDLCRRVLQAQPAHGATLNLLAAVVYQRGDAAAGIDLLRQAIEVNGGVPLYHSNLGEMCRVSGRLDEAVAAGRRAVELQPNYARAWNNLGIAYYDRDELDAAEECYRHAVELVPDFAEAYSNLANARLARADTAEALALYRRAVLLKPDYVDAHNNLAMTLLLTGDFTAGWRELEWRRQRPSVSGRGYAGPRWQGESFAGKTLLVHAEEGHGDAIHFMRYLPEVAKRGGSVVLAVHRGLARLAGRIAGVSAVIQLDAPAPPFDLQCPLMSVPLVLGTTLESVPAEVPYLSVDDAVVDRWRLRLRAAAGLKVGLVWSGALKYVNNRRRAIPAERLAPLLELEGVSWFSLQVGKRAADLAHLPAGKVTDLSSELTDYAETAGAILGLDLVISTDTSVPHLAGALARPVWLLLAFMPDWRWLLGRETTPWYPRTRLFRQPGREEWDRVVQRVAEELRAVVGGDRARLLPAGDKAAA